MKKILGLLIMSVLCITGCTSEEEKVMTCTRTATQSSIKIELNYNITYQGNYVKNVESIEKIIAEDPNVLETYKENIENVYEPYKDIEYYEYHVTIEGDTLTSEANINYEKINTDEMIQVDSANAQVIKDGKVSIDDLQSMYESVGASCTR